MQKLVRPDCSDRLQLVACLEALLDEYYLRVQRLAVNHGFVAAEEQCQIDYDACVELRESLKSHMREHGCGMHDQANAKTA